MSVTLQLLAALLLFVVVERALTTPAALLAVLVTCALSPLAMAFLLAMLLRDVDGGVPVRRVLPAMAGLCAIVTMVALPLSAREPVAASLQGLGARYPEVGASLGHLSASLGRALTDAPPRREPAAAADAGAPTTVEASVDAPDASAPVDASLDASPGDAGAPVDVRAGALDGRARDAGRDGGVVNHVLARVYPCEAPRSVVVADLEGDARDEVVLQCAQSLHVLALSEGMLFERVRYLPAAPPGYVVELGAGAAADMDGDGRRDVLLCEHQSREEGGGRGGATRYLLNRGDGRFEGVVTVDRPDGCGAVALGDVTGDSRDELLVAHTGDPLLAAQPQGDLTVFARTPRGWSRRARLAVGRRPAAIAVTDVSGDTIGDAVVTHAWEHTPAVVLLGSRAGLRPIDATLRVPDAPPQQRSVARLDRDDEPDAVELAPDGALVLRSAARVLALPITALANEGPVVVGAPTPAPGATAVVRRAR